MKNRLNNLYLIGHLGNLKRCQTLFEKEEGDGDFLKNKHENMFGAQKNYINLSEGGGGQSSEDSKLLKEQYSFTQSVQNLTTKSNMLRILVPQLDQIFEVIQSSPFSGLESVGLMNYMDFTKNIEGIRIPTPSAGLFSKRGKSK